MKRLLIFALLALTAFVGRSETVGWLYWCVEQNALPEAGFDFAYAVLCDGEDWTMTYTVGETGASKVRANADALSTPAVASNISGTASA